MIQFMRLLRVSTKREEDAVRRRSSLPTSFPAMQQSPALVAAQIDPLSLSTQRQLASQSRGLEGRTVQRVTSMLRIVFP